MRVNLLIGLVLIGFLPLFLLGKIFLGTFLDTAITSRISELQKQGSILSTRIDVNGYMNNQKDSTVDTEIELLTYVYAGRNINGRILIVDSNLTVIKDTFESEKGKTLISEEVIKSFNGSSGHLVDHKNQFVELTIPVINSNKETIGVMIMRFSIENIYSIYHSLNNSMNIISIALITLVILFAFFYSKRVTKPLEAITHSIDHISEGYMDEVHIKGYLEIDKISDSFNQMISHMKTLEDSRQEFVSNVSHELKTPITSVKVLADSLLSQEDAPVEMYREFLVDIRDEIDRENKIINDLLSLVKLDKTAGEMNITSININELLEQILKRLRPIAQKRNIEMIYESFRPVIAEIDEVKLSLAISNLIENAIKYNVEDGWIRVSLNADHKYFYVKVADSGVGIPEDCKDLIFERFYRVDKARSRETGGTGLGLSIARNAIHMHRGAIKVYSKEKEGTTFTVRIPINFIA